VNGCCNPEWSTGWQQERHLGWCLASPIPLWGRTGTLRTVLTEHQWWCCSTNAGGSFILHYRWLSCDNLLVGACNGCPIFASACNVCCHRRNATVRVPAHLFVLEANQHAMMLSAWWHLHGSVQPVAACHRRIFLIMYRAHHSGLICLVLDDPSLASL
jgi:hypothetical protein